MITVCVVLTGATFAVNDAEVEPEATVTMAGTETALLVVARMTFKALAGAALIETVHVVLPASAKEVVAHENALMAGNSTAVDGGDMEIETVLRLLSCVAVMMPV